MSYGGPILSDDSKSGETAYYISLETSHEDSDINIDSIKKQRYLDPWDLENYAYIQRTVLEQQSSRPSSTPSPAGAPISSKFHYLSGNVESECPTCCAELDEYYFFNEKYEVINDEYLPYGIYTDIDDIVSEQNNDSCSSSSYSSEKTIPTRHVVTSDIAISLGHRSIVLPKPIPQIEFPAPPSYDYYHLSSVASILDTEYCNLTECSDCLSGDNSSSTSISIPLYVPHKCARKQSTNSSHSSRINFRQNHIGLNKKGLLQIDYSCNWMRLNNFICK